MFHNVAFNTRMCPLIFIIFYYRPCILVFDSSYGMSPLNVGSVLVDYLYWEYKPKINSSIKLKDFDLKCIYPKVPQQHNAFDCGIYILQYVEIFFSVRLIRCYRYHYALKQTVISLL